MIDRKTFYDYVRNAPFGGRLTPQNVQGMEAILDEYEKNWSTQPTARIAYILATAYLETAGMMVPVREGSRAGKILTDAEARAFVKKQGYKYGVERYGHVYYGRGLVQITWYDNYKRMASILEIDLVNNPDLALDPKIAVVILFEGMFKGVSNRGDFTGKSLENYILDTPYDDVSMRKAFVASRPIVNGTDKAEQIANIAMNFWRGLNAARAKRVSAPVKVKEVVDSNPVPVSRTPEVVGAASLGMLATLSPFLSTILEKVSGVWGFASLVFIVSAALIAWVVYSRNKVRFVTGE